MYQADPETVALAPHGARLSDALRAMIEASPLQGLGPIEMARVLGVDRTLASRLLTALRAPDPVVALSALPGTSPLRQFIRAARARGAEGGAADAAEGALRAFEEELLRHFGNRTRLDAALADAVPEARRRQLDTARQSVYRGMSLIKGVSIDLACITWIVHPSVEQQGRIDTRVVAGFLGVRRLRASAKVHVAAKHDHPARGEGLLKEFCRPGDLSITSAVQDGMTVYEVHTRSIRQDDAADVFFSELIPGAPASPRAGHAYGDAVSHPYKKLVLNVLVHPHVWPGCRFVTCAYDTVLRGVMCPSDQRTESERLELDAPVTESLAVAETLAGFGVPRYGEMLGAAAGVGDLGLYRLFSCGVVYPLYGTQVVMEWRGA